ncbi:hypothetical protein L195_g055316 [Trifolium pratense]|uniref:Uncharacterized protein n=1 Tax=Trifolium pratense TaxID=57577 RepID=A0A2K3KKQ7_TRIPR|nr:hypothetical protein L195_g055316 [Trifolium pratense]
MVDWSRISSHSIVRPSMDCAAAMVTDLWLRIEVEVIQSRSQALNVNFRSKKSNLCTGSSVSFYNFINLHHAQALAPWRKEAVTPAQWRRPLAPRRSFQIKSNFLDVHLAPCAASLRHGAAHRVQIFLFKL